MKEENVENEKEKKKRSRTVALVLGELKANAQDLKA